MRKTQWTAIKFGRRLGPAQGGQIIMKIQTLIVLGSAFLLSGCLGTDTLNSWKGRNLTDLVYAWGPPDRQDRLPDGRAVITYSHQRLVGLNTMECEAVFGADKAGIIRDATASGNIGGCNRMLLTKPSAQ
jgi:hypothetical protein